MRMLAILTALPLALMACGGDDGAKHDAGIHDAPVDAGAGGPDASCFTDPHTHYEIINACTSAEKRYKPGHPALQYPDGGLPPTP